MGVSGGGGDPRVALVVEVEAVEANRFIALAVGAIMLGFWEDVPLSSAAPGIGGGMYCC